MELFKRIAMNFKGLNFYVIFSFCLILMACESKWESSLRKVDGSPFSFNNYEGWELVQEIKNDDSFDFLLKKKDGDTLKSLLIYLSNNGEVYVNHYDKKFPCNDIDTCYLYFSSTDTLYYYSQRNKVKTFIKGEYAYRFMFMQLKISEKDYYLLYEDSLKKVIGTDLPRLPELNEKEKLQLENLLKSK